MEQKQKSKIIVSIIITIDNLMKHIGILSIQFKKYVGNMDGWVKSINKRMSAVDSVGAVAGENADNIQHNYELIYEMKDQIEEMKQEINALKLIQIISLKKTTQEENLLRIFL